MKFDWLFNECEKELILFLKDDGFKAVNYDELEYIFTETERHWNEYINLLSNLAPGGKVHYLLIMEGAPQSDTKLKGLYTQEYPRYVFNPHSKNNLLLGNLCRMFVNQIPTDSLEKIRMIARNGVLVVDCLPFALKYRANKAYSALVRRAFSVYLEQKLSAVRIKWDSSLKVAIGYKRLGTALLEAKAQISLPGLKPIQLEQSHVAYCSNVPCPATLREAFGIGRPQDPLF